jgi:serine/threonine protein kinase
MSGISYTTFERDFRFENRIGKGNYATVLKVQHLLDLRSYALKSIEVPTPEEMAQAFNEIETNRSIDDEHTLLPK